MNILILHRFEPFANALKSSLKFGGIQATTKHLTGLAELLGSQEHRQHHYDAVISDLVLEDARGLEIVQTLGRLFPQISVLFIVPEFWEQEIPSLTMQGHRVLDMSMLISQINDLMMAPL